VVAVQTVVEAGSREVLDGPTEVVHSHRHAPRLGELGDLELDRLAAVLRGVGHRDRTGTGDLEVGGLVLVSVGMTAGDDRLGPARDQTGHVLTDDRFAENDAAEDVRSEERRVGKEGRPWWSPD